MKLCVRQTVILFAASSAIINALPMPDFFSDISDEFTGFGFFGATDVANQAASWGQGIGDSIADFGAQAGFALKDGFNQDMEWAKTGMDYMDFGMKTASSYAGNAIGQGVGYTVDGGMLGSEGLLNGVGDSKDASNIENQRQGVVDLVTKETSKYATEAVMPVLGLVMAGGVLLGVSQFSQ